MGLWFMMLGFDLLIPAVMLVAGKLFTISAPKEINYLLGYRTTMSMKNADTWQYAHKVAGGFWWKWGWVALAITVIPMLFVLGQTEDTVSIAGLVIMCAQLILLVSVIPYTEKALRKAFDEEGNRRTNNDH